MSGADATEPPRIDWVAAALAVAMSVVIVSTVWLRFGPGRESRGKQPRLGAASPPLVLGDVDTGAPQVVPLGGPGGGVVWVSFWSVSSQTTRADLAALEPVWARLRSRSRFTMAVAAIESDASSRVRATRDAAHTTLPLALAPSATCRSFGAERSVLPLHVLIDEDGRVVAIAHGHDEATLTRLTEQAERRLDDLEPLGHTRFARSGSVPGTACSARTVVDRSGLS